MKKLLSLLKSTKILTFLGTLLLTFAVFGVYLKTRYSNDCYSLLFHTEDFPYQASSQGRPLNGLIALFSDKTGFSLVGNQLALTLVSFVVFSFAISVLVETLIKLKNSSSIVLRMFATITSFMVVFNIFYVDLFPFSFMMLAFSLSMLFVILAFKFFVERKSKLDILKALFCLVISIFFYQSMLPLFIPLCLIAIWFGTENQVIEKVKSSIIGFICYGFVLAVDLGYIKFIHNNFFIDKWRDARADKKPEILNNLEYIWDLQYKLWVQAFGFMKNYIFVSFVILFALIFILSVKKFKDKVRAKLILIFILIAFLVAVFLPNIFSGETFISPRSVSTFASIPGLILFAFVLKQNEWLEKLNWKNIAIFSFVLMYFCYQAFAIQRVAKQGQIQKQLDSFYSAEIYKKIEEYEKQSGEKVTTLIMRNDYTPMYCYKEVNCYGVYTKALSVPWSRVESINLVSGREFLSREMTVEEYREIFNEKTWDEFVVEEQIRFEGEKVFVIVF